MTLDCACCGLAVSIPDVLGEDDAYPCLGCHATCTVFFDGDSPYFGSWTCTHGVSGDEPCSKCEEAA